jgi:hypothetical protein
LACHSHALQERVVLLEALGELLRERLPVRHAVVMAHAAALLAAPAEARMSAALHRLALARLLWLAPTLAASAASLLVPRHLEALRRSRSGCSGRRRHGLHGAVRGLGATCPRRSFRLVFLVVVVEHVASDYVPLMAALVR